MKVPWLSLLVLAMAACGGKSPPETAPPPTAEDRDHDHPAETPPADGADPAEEDLAAAETAAYERAKPVFEKYCSKCHAKGGKNAKPKSLEHFDMTSYPFGGHHAVEIGAEVRKVLGIGGGKATMPMDDPGSVKGDELALIAAWADAHDEAHEGGAHRDRGHGDGEHHHGGDHHH